jgi:SAM-dependent methyltransferase
MLKYVMTATALKAFSVSPATKRVYRMLGNTVGQRRRTQRGLRSSYVARAKQLLALCERYCAVHSGDRVLEIGTGWLHWESTIIRLFYDVEATLFDVWDNRNFEAYKRWLDQLESIIDQEIDMAPIQSARVHHLLRAISKARSFDEVYRLLDFRYAIDAYGLPVQLPSNHFAAIYSYNVLEHVHRSILPDFGKEIYRLLKSGGYSFHRIDLGDHLADYDASVSPKNYLRYSDKVWRRYFENDVQYFNRVQRPEWLEIFQQAGLEELEEESQYVDLDAISVDRRYRDLSQQDLRCVELRVVHRRP